MKRMNLKRLWHVPVLLAAASFTACLDSGEETIVLEEGTISIAGIPSDDLATPNPEITSPTTTIPNVNYTLEYEDDNAILRLDMTGVQNPDGGWLNLIGTGGNGSNRQNVWVSVDGIPKGIAVYNNSENQGDRTLLTDVVFLVDNSGSMSEEADAIARDIVDWARTLTSSFLDVRFGCVGYADGGNVSGALDLTTVTALSSYLNRSGVSGTSRTKGFYGSNASALSSAASRYDSNDGECGVVALRFADEKFSGFRNGASRVYVNFTDEPNQAGGSSGWSVNYVNNQNQWNAAKGTIHTVYSETDTNQSETTNYRERPWRLSEYTGGTTLFTNRYFTGVTLNDLPVTGAMQNSYIIRFTNIGEFMDGQTHEVKITILTADGKVQAEKVFYIVFPEA